MHNRMTLTDEIPGKDGDDSRGGDRSIAEDLGADAAESPGNKGYYNDR